MKSALPIDEALPELESRLRAFPNLVLIAPPGAGKTTRVPQALIDARLIESDQRVLVLEPRRLAARLAAQRIASERGVRIGEEVGYQIRFDDKTSKRTRIAILTEGILTRRIQSDPTLDGVGAVVLDEFHERSIHADLALAFLREIQETVRPELKVIVMSATLDPGPVASFLGGAPVLESKGRAYPIEIEYLEHADERFPVELLVSGVRRALRETTAGDVLAFLPGAGEIRRAQESLLGHVGDKVDVSMLYGELDAASQDRALASPPQGRRKVILATNIAETSLTIPGVSCVVDLGLQKIQRHDPARGIDRLELLRISKRSAEQRAGRAGRTGPGRAFRLWTEKEQRTLLEDDPPEVARIDLAPVLLEIVRWTGRDPRAFRWLDAPPQASVDRALGLLADLGALSKDGHKLTPRGEQLGRFPLHPRLAALLSAAHKKGVLEAGAKLAALASERDIVRRDRRRDAPSDKVESSDLIDRLELLDAIEAEGLSSAGRWGADQGAVRSVFEVARRLEATGRDVLGKEQAASEARAEETLLRVIMAGFPDRVGKRRSKGDELIVMAGGGGLRLAKESVVKEAELLVAIEIDGSAQGSTRGPGLIRIASQIERRWLEEDVGGVAKHKTARWNPTRMAAEAWLELRFHELLLEERPDPDGSAEAIAAVLEKAAAEDLERALPITDELSELFARVALLRKLVPELELPELGPDSRRMVLPELCADRKSFAELQKLDLVEALLGQLSHAQKSALAKEAPVDIPVPSGRRARLRYEHDGPPTLSVKLQEIFGLYETPRVARGRAPVRMELLAPNQRPVQVTQDLKSFWANTYAEVRQELRRRYPRHQWPEDPREGIPSAKPRPRKR